MDPHLQLAVAGLLDWIRVRAPRRPDRVLYHVFGVPEMWPDGFNGAPQFLAAMGHFDEALAQMLVYAVYEGVRAGWLPPDYRAHADAMRAATRQKMDADGFVQGACGAPNFDRPGISTEAQAFSILMENTSTRLH